LTSEKNNDIIINVRALTNAIRNIKWERIGIMFKEKVFGYVEEVGVFGEIVGADFRNGLYVIETEDDEQVAVKFADVEILEKAFVIHGVDVFNKDVLGDINGKMYQVELHKDGKIQLHKLNDKLEVVNSGGIFEVTETIVNQLESVMDLHGNIYELMAELPQAPDFNIKIVKDFNGKFFTYFYACNNKDEEEIDLIKVLFIGHHTLEEEEYERRTISHEVYQDSIESGTLKEVSPQELMNYVTGLTYSDEDEEVEDEDACGYENECAGGERECGCGFYDNASSYNENVEKFNELHEEEEPEIYEDCENVIDECDCDLW